jgi:CelD/BcsL family acetyltransferase involved in cellulose biosynthesis
VTQSSVGKFNIEVVPSLGDAEAIWRAFEIDALATPYQRYDWVRLWQEHVLPDSGNEIVTVLVRSGRDLVAIFPFGIRKRNGLRIATIAGGCHANFQMPLSQDSFRPDDAELRELLNGIGTALDADVISFQHQPGSWGEAPNPLAGMLSERDSNSAFVMSLHRDFDALARARRSARSLQQIRRKRRNLEAFKGPVTFKRARDAETCARVIDEAVRQRSARRRTSGIPSFFDLEGAREFVQAATVAGLEQPESDCTMLVHYLEAGDTIVASYFGGSSQGAYSCFLNAFDLDFQKFSPGDIILHDLIAHFCRQGLRQLDLGAGDEHYKRVWCDRIDLYATTVPVTIMGSLYSSGLRPLLMAKRSIKQNEFLLASWRTARRLTA